MKETKKHQLPTLPPITPKQRTMAFVIVAMVFVLGGIFIYQRNAQLAQPDSGNTMLRKDLPGISSAELQTFIPAKRAYSVAFETAKKWHADVQFISAESVGYTADGKSKYWQFTFGSPELQKTNTIKVGTEGITNQYEGVGIDFSGIKVTTTDPVGIDTNIIAELVLKDPAIKTYITTVAGQVNPSYSLKRGLSIIEQPIMDSIVGSEFVWNIVFTFVKDTNKALDVWVDSKTGRVLLSREIAPPTKK